MFVLTIQNISAFKWFAALIKLIPCPDVVAYLDPIMATLYRAFTDSTSKGSEADDIRALAGEVLDLIKQVIGTDKYLELFNAARAKAVKQRLDRKQQRAVEVFHEFNVRLL